MVIAILGTACSGMRPALDTAGPKLATLFHPKSPVLYFGDGCYVADRTVVSCSIDSLPAGRMVCAVEPSTEFRVAEIANARVLGGDPLEWYHDPKSGESPELYYDSNLDSFAALLDSHRCHERYFDSFTVPPVSISIRDVRQGWSSHLVPLADLGLSAMPSTIAVSRSSAREICRNEQTRERFVVPVCVDAAGEVTIDSMLLRMGYSDVPDFLQSPHGVLEQDFAGALVAARGTPNATKRCALVEVDAPAISCNVAPERVVSTSSA
jgi:hypothetical protein